MSDATMEVPRPPRIDVLIPAYNAVTTIAESVRSMQQQSVVGIRIIVVDDGSTDGTGELLDEMAAQDARLVIVHRANGGIVAALNEGLALCTGDFVARHDSDDNAYPERLGAQAAYLDAHPDCVAVGSNAVHIGVDGALLGSRTEFRGDVAPDAQAVPSREPYLLHPFLMVRRRPLQSIGGYRYAFHSEDTDLYWRLLTIGRLHNLDAIHGEYRRHEGSISSASVVNGRVSAVNSQLAALSYRRREAQQEDLTFPAALLARYQDARTLERMLEVASTGLRPDEAAYLEVAAAGKLLHLVAYRPYQLDLEDCRFIRSSIRRRDVLIDAASRYMLQLNEKAVVMKLLRSRRVREAVALLSARVFLRSAKHWVRGRLVPGARTA